MELLEDRIVPTKISLPASLTASRGSIVSVPINVDTLNDPANGNTGMSGANFALFYDQTDFTVSTADISVGTITTGGSTAVNKGFTAAAGTGKGTNGWSLVTNLSTLGRINIGLSNNGSGIVTDTGSGSLAIINFHIKSNALLGSSHLDLAADTFGNPPFTSIADQFFSDYSLNPAPQDNVSSLSPYAYVGSDPVDCQLTVSGINFPPVAITDTYTITTRTLASDPSLNVGLNAVQTLKINYSIGPDLVTGNFTLAFAGSTTAAISYSSVSSVLQSRVQTALAGLATIGAGNVSVSATSASTLTVAFQNLFGVSPQPLVVAASSLLERGNAVPILISTTTNGTPGVLGNDTDPQNFALTATLLSSPPHGTVAFNSNGSFTYTPAVNFLGSDSFTYLSNDGFSNSNTATVNLTITPRLSIPTTLTGALGGNIIVPVNVDNPDPAGSGGLTELTLALSYDPAVFTIASSAIGLGVLNGATSAVQGIAFGGAITGGTFTLSFDNTSNSPPGVIKGTTSPIPYTTAAATLQSNIQTALDALMGTNNVLVSAASATSVQVAFQNALGGASEPLLSVNSSLAGSSPSVLVTALTSGLAPWNLATNIGTGANAGKIGLTTEGSAIFNTAAGSMVLLTFGIRAGASLGPSAVNIAATIAFTGGGTVITRLDSSSGFLPLKPPPTNQTNDPGIDGVVNVVAIPRFGVSGPTTVLPGQSFNFTALALNGNGTSNPGYAGTVHIAASDAHASLPANATLTNGIGVFAATLQTVGNQILSVFDAGDATQTGSSTIAVAGPPAHLVVTAPPVAQSGTPILFTVTARDSFNNVALGYSGTIHFNATDSSALLPPNATLSNGIGIFSATLQAFGDQMLTAADTASALPAGSSFGILVSSPAASLAAVPRGIFAASQQFPAGSGPAAVVLGDFNSDGIADEAIADSTSNSVSILLGNGDGNFGAPGTVALGAAPTALQVGDFNGDGHLDLAVVENAANKIGILLGNGAGGFAAATSINVATAPTALAVADLNGDGRADLAVASNSSVKGTLSLFYGTGTGTFGLGSTYAVGSEPSAVAAADFDGDGRPDIAVANAGDFNVSILLAVSTGGFAPAVNFAAGQQPLGMAVGDFDHNGTLDLATANALNSTVSVLLGNGNGTFAGAANYAAGSSPTAIVVGNFDGDSNLDLAVVNGNDNTVSILLGNGTGAFAPQLVFDIGPGPGGIAVGDVNGDGKTDLSVVNSTSNSLTVLLCNGKGGVFVPPMYPATIPPDYLATGDFNGDSRPDLVFINATSHSASVILGNGSGGFTPSAVATAAGNLSAVVTGDFNNDGKLDFAVLLTGTNNVEVFPGNGAGGFGTPKTFAAGNDPEALVAADFNGDGKLDLAVANAASNQVSLLLGNGAGGFAAPAAYAVGQHPRALVAADFNNDGKLDLASANFNNTTSILLNNLGGGFAPAVNYAVGASASAIATGDFNGDGQPDLVVVNGSLNSISVSLDNAGAFATQTTYAAGLTLQSVVTGDFNGDGKMDIAVSGTDSKSVSMFLGTGTGSFGPPATFQVPGSPIALAAADFDGNGSLDLAMTAPSSGSVAVFLNQAAASSFLITAPPGITAGSSFNVTVTAIDQLNNPVVGYQGTVHFSSNDSQAVLPLDARLTNGRGVFAANTNKAGVLALTVADTARNSTNGTGLLTVNPAPASHFVLTVPAKVQSGVAFTMTMVALDTFNNQCSNYTGTVHFTSSDPHAILPPSQTLPGGQGIFSATLLAGGLQTLTVTDPGTIGLSATAQLVFDVSLSIPNSLGGNRCSIVPVPINVSNLVDSQAGNFGLGAANFVLYYDASRFSVAASDVLIGSLPGASTGWSAFANTLVAGEIIVGLISDGIHVITASAGGSLVIVNFHIKANAMLGPTRIDLAADVLTGPPVTGIADQNYLAYSLSPAPLDNTILTPTYAYTGSDPDDGTVTITGVNLPPVAANDAFSITARALASDPALTVASPGVLANDSDPQSFPMTSVKVAGPAHGTVTLNADGSFVYTPAFGYVGPDSFTYTATNGFATSSTAAVNLNVTPRLSIPTNLFGSAGHTVVVPVNIDNPNPAGSGGLAAAVIAIDYDPNVFSVGDADLHTGTLTAGWTLVPNINAVTGQIAVFIGSNVPLTSTAPGSVLLLTMHIKSGTPLGATPINLAATNSPSGNTVTTRLSALNGDLPLRPPATNATNDANVDGLVTVVNPPALVVNSLTPTPTGFVAVFNKPISTAQLNLYDAAFGGNGAADLTLTGSNGLTVRGSLITDPTATTITFVKTGTGTPGLLAADTYTLTLRSASNAFTDSGGNLLDGNSDGTAGDSFISTFSVAAPQGPVLSIPDFARGPDGADTILVPNRTGTGIPITLTNAAAVTDLSFDLHYDPSLLSISTAQGGPSGTLTLLSASGGVASFVFHAGTAQSGDITLGQIIAVVPPGAASNYRAKELLHLSNIVVNAGSIGAVGNDGVHVNAYLGDTSGDGSVSGLDASQIGRVSILLDSGFAAFPLLDPVIIGDVGVNGSVDGSDITLINRQLAGIATPQLPPIPTSLTIVPTGPDPSLSLPVTQQAAPGETVIVPVNIDTAHPQGSTGATEAILALKYDPAVFDVSAADVLPGFLTQNGWQLLALVNPVTGEIGIDLFSADPILTTAAGSLVTIALHVRGSAPAGSTGLTLVTQVNPTGQRAFRTEVADSQGALVLHQASTADGPEPGLPGVVIVGPGINAEMDQLVTPGAPSSGAGDPAASTIPPGNLAAVVFGEFALATIAAQATAWAQLAPVNADHLADAAQPLPRAAALIDDHPQAAFDPPSIGHADAPDDIENQLSPPDDVGRLA
jgi:hypothetical protein